MSRVGWRSFSQRETPAAAGALVSYVKDVQVIGQSTLPAVVRFLKGNGFEPMCARDEKHI
jgi:hypothetical protein